MSESKETNRPGRPPLVMLRGNWPGNFRRILRDETGKPTGQELIFQPGVPVELSPEEFAFILQEVGQALLIVELDDKQRVRIVDVPADEVADVVASRDEDKQRPKRGREPKSPPAPTKEESDADESDDPDDVGDEDGNDADEDEDSDDEESSALQIVSSQTKAAKALEVSRNEFRELMDTPGFPPTPPGRTGYNVTAIRAWIAAGKPAGDEAPTTDNE